MPRQVASTVLPLSLVAVALILSGCGSMPDMPNPTQAKPHPMDAANTAYVAGDYRTAYVRANAVAVAGSVADRQAGHYTAGMAGLKLGKYQDAEEHLNRAALGPHPQITGAAAISLGTLHMEQESFAASARAYTLAAQKLSDENRAHALYFAGQAYRRLGNWDKARDALLKAKVATTDLTLKRRIEQQLAITGFTLQLGAYRQRGNAVVSAQRLSRHQLARQLGNPWLTDAVDPMGKPIYLVQIGAFRTQAQAKSALDHAGFDNAIVVPTTK